MKSLTISLRSLINFHLKIQPNDRKIFTKRFTTIKHAYYLRDRYFRNNAETVLFNCSVNELLANLFMYLMLDFKDSKMKGFHIDVYRLRPIRQIYSIKYIFSSSTNGLVSKIVQNFLMQFL